MARPAGRHETKREKFCLITSFGLELYLIISLNKIILSILTLILVYVELKFWPVLSVFAQCQGRPWNHKRVYRMYRELKLDLRIKPRKRKMAVWPGCQISPKH